jgi:hypothetical protein
LAAQVSAIPSQEHGCGPRSFRLTPEQHCRPSLGKRKFFAKGIHAAQNRFPTQFGKEKRSRMQISKLSKGLLLGLAMVLGTSAFAANKAKLRVDDPLSVAGNELKTGDYTVSWDGNGPDVQLNIMKGSKVVATTPARIVNTDRAPDHDSAVVNMKGGSRDLTEIRFSGKKYALAIGGEAGGSASGGSGVR